jgi:hypothetical protein
VRASASALALATRDVQPKTGLGHIRHGAADPAEPGHAENLAGNIGHRHAILEGQIHRAGGGIVGHLRFATASMSAIVCSATRNEWLQAC